MSTSATFGDLLRRHRVAAGLSQEELAERAGLSARGISDLERGVRSTPYRDTVRMLADALALNEADRGALQVAARRPAAPVAAGAGSSRSVEDLLSPLTPLLGREREVDAAMRLLRRTDVRLLTLTGAGGIGKTRVGLQVAADLRDDFTDGVAFVALAPVGDPDLVLPSIAQVLRLTETAGRPWPELVAEWLREKHLLLALDNLEHLLPAAPAIATLLERCPRLKVLATSRASLRLSGERELPVPPLDLPESRNSEWVENPRGYAAVELFCQRAEAVDPAFALTPATAPVVAEIVRRLDGLPLAIELAAARSKVLLPEAILARLDRRLSLLTGGARDLPRRQQTLRDTIVWSYDLLTPTEQALFRRLAVFAGGCTLEAVEAVCHVDRDLPLDVLDGLGALVEQSLLVRVAGGIGTAEPRFAMLATIREVAREQLLTSGEVEQLGVHHARFMLAFVREASRALHGAASIEAGERLVQELDNIRAALHWCVAHDDAALGSRFAWALQDFWHRRGLTREAWEWDERLLTLPSAVGRTMSRARLLAAAAEAMSTTADMATTRRYAVESVTISRDVGDTVCLANALRVLGWSHLRQNEFGAARASFEQCLPLLRELGDRPMVGAVLGYLATTANSDGDTTAARAYATEALVAAHEVGDPWMIGYALRYLGVLAETEGDNARARHLLEESVQLFRASGDSIDAIKATNALARLAQRQGELDRAAQLIGEGLRIGQVLGEPVEMLETLEDAAALAAHRGDPAGAARLAGATAAMRDERGVPRHHELRAPYEDALAAMRVALGEDAFAAAWVEGRALSLDAAVASALEQMAGHE